MTAQEKSRAQVEAHLAYLRRNDELNGRAPVDVDTNPSADKKKKAGDKNSKAWSMQGAVNGLGQLFSG